MSQRVRWAFWVGAWVVVCALRAPAAAVGGPACAIVPALGAAEFSGGRAHVGRVEIGLATLGRDGAAVALDAGARAVRAGDEVHLSRAPGVLEWWRAVAAGLEQGVTVAARPSGEGPLALEMSVGHGMHATEVGDDEIALRDPAGARVATYSHLVVLDALGARVPARLSASAGGIRIEVDDGNARYPLVIDPLLVTEEAFLTSGMPATDDAFGYSASMSLDGSRAIVGDPLDDAPLGTPDAGSVSIFHRTGTGWSGVAVLRPTDLEPNSRFGSSVGISSDGTRAIVGAPGDAVRGDPAGTARVYRWSGTAWEPEATLEAPGAGPADEVGAAVALDGTGTRALVGSLWGAGTAVGSGRALVFVRTGTAWALETELMDIDVAAGDQFGCALAFDATGSRALVGAMLSETAGPVDSGAAYLFERSVATWTLRATLVAVGARTGDRLGASVALSADGLTAIAGAPLDDVVLNNNEGTARVFFQSGPFWSQQAVLSASDGALDDNLGASVALSADGSIAAIGVPRDEGLFPEVDTGSVRFFVRGASSWTPDVTVRTSPIVPNGSRFGDSVALSGDGSRLLVGAADDTAQLVARAGSARVFTVRATSGNGVSCALPSECFSGHCIDGVCCDAACGGGSATDCQACSVAAGAAADGTCAPRPTDTVCRASSAACDAAELCDGTSTACPGDARAAPGTVCRSSAGPCDVEETCNGATTACPADGFLSPLFICRPAAAGGCDVQETCTGTGALCPADNFAPATTLCGLAPSGVCDAADHCAGTSAECVPTFLSGVSCRDASGVCDSPEFCAGTSAECAPDAVEAAGMPCRVSVDPSCDPAEACDGVATACPADVTSCVVGTDAGSLDGGPEPLDAGMGADAGIGADGGPGADAAVADAGAADGGVPAVDAGATPVAVQGCACRSGAGSLPRAATFLAFVSFLALVRRRARRG